MFVRSCSSGSFESKQTRREQAQFQSKQHNPGGLSHHKQKAADVLASLLAEGGGLKATGLEAGALSLVAHVGLLVGEAARVLDSIAHG